MRTISVEAEILDLWEREGRALRRYFRMALNGDAEAAEDLTAETFTMLAEAFGRGPVREPEGLLRTIAKRRLIKEIERRRDDPLPVGDLYADEHEQERLAMFAPDTLEASEFRTDFDRALRGLPSTERDAFILTELRGLSTHAAAPILGVSQETVRRRKEIATDSVRSALLAG